MKIIPHEATEESIVAHLQAMHHSCILFHNEMNVIVFLKESTEWFNDSTTC